MRTTVSVSRSPSAARPHPIWPLPALNGQHPVLLIHDLQDPGVELAYEESYVPDGPMVRSLRHAGTDPFYLPSLTPVFAVFDGTIVYAGKHVTGHTMIIQHGNGWMTYYARMEHMLALSTDRKRVGPAARVKAGSVIGYAGSAKPSPLRTLRFELWKLDDECGYIAIDPIRFMRRWGVVPWVDKRHAPIDTAPPRKAA